MSDSIVDPVLLSLRVAACSTLFVVPVAVAIAWVLSRSRVPAKGLLISLINLPLVLPPVVSGFFLLDLFGRRGVFGRILAPVGIVIPFTWVAAVLASFVISLPLAVWTTRLAFDGIDPALENAARLLGRSEWRVFWEVTLPLARRGLLGATILAFARSLGEFGATMVVAGTTPGETLTVPSAIYLYMQRPGMDGTVNTLVWTAAGLSFLALSIVNVVVWNRQ